jgi:hypothetical protein
VWAQTGRGFGELLGDLGIVSFASLQKRGEHVNRYLPRVRAAEAINVASSGVEDYA